LSKYHVSVVGSLLAAVPDLTGIADIKINKRLRARPRCGPITPAVIVTARLKLANQDEATMKSSSHLIVILALLSSSAEVSAEAWKERTVCTNSRFYGTSSCRTIGSWEQAPTRDPAQEAEDYKAKQEGIKKWEAFCKPTRRQDELGVVRLAYARSGCEFGVSE